MNLEYSDIDKGFIVVTEKATDDLDGFIYQCKHKDMFYASYLKRLYASDLILVEKAIESINKALEEDGAEKADLMCFDQTEKTWGIQ